MSMRIFRGRHPGLVPASLLLWCGAGLFVPTAAAAESCKLPAIEGKVELEATCVYHQSIVIRKPTVLDCNGATLDGEGRLATGIRVESDGKPLQDVEVRNCTVRNFTKLGIGVGWSLHDGGKQREMGAADAGDYEARTPSGTVIADTKVLDIDGVGIFIDDHAVDTRLERVTVKNATGAGVYLEHDSRNTTIDAAHIEGNGWKGGAGVQPGLAIDASQSNVVRNSTFRKNGQGGIYLYRNCGEQVGINPKAVPRKNGANGNLIENNLLEEKNGIRVAARMSRNVRTMQCGRKPYYDADDIQIVLDEATGNTIRGNKLNGGQWGIVVEDNDNVVERNTFTGEFTGAPILVGTKYRATQLRRPVVGVRVVGNSIQGRRKAQWIYGSAPD